MAQNLSDDIQVNSADTATVLSCDKSKIHKNCDSLEFLDNNSHSKNIDFTNDPSFEQMTHKRKVSKQEEAAINTEATASSLLNLIVKIARASINLNILTSNSDDLKNELKKNGKI